MNAADPTVALADYLTGQLEAKTEGTIAEGLRVLRPEIPRDEESLMPVACVVVLPDPTGGTGRLHGRDDLPVWDSRLAIYCYGSTRLESQDLGRNVEVALRKLTTSIYEHVKVYWVRHEGGAWGEEAKEDPNTLWPVTVVLCQVLHDMETH